MGLRDRQLAKIVESARRFLEPGEEVRFALGGQSGARAWTVVGTDAAVYVLKGSAWSVTKAGSLEARVTLEDAPLVLEVIADAAQPILVAGTRTIRLGTYTDEDLEALIAVAGAGGDG